jgi:NAD(P)-dependent dehydrogenase (short-subunit alcohol dehydrogenase family)
VTGIPSDLLAGRRVLVTGGSRGIGLAVVEVALRAGARCAVLARTDESLRAAAEQVGEIVTVRADIGDRTRIRPAVDTAAEQLGGLDVLVNAAARVSGREPDGVFTVTPELLLADFAEKIVGYLETARAAHPYLRDSGRGRIVNIGGEAVRLARHNVSSGARNAALVHLTRSLAMEFGPDGIRVNAVHPGVVRTANVDRMLAERSVAAGDPPEALAAAIARRTAIRRLVEPVDVANTVAFLASDLADGITGEGITVSGGSSAAVHY